MPAASPKQRRYLYWRFGSAWVHEHHFDQLAQVMKPEKKRKRKRG